LQPIGKNLMRSALLFAVTGLWLGSVSADTTQARCDIYPRGEDHASQTLACTFSQRQGSVSIAREDGVRYELSTQGDDPGNYLDQDGRAAYRQSGLGDQGLIFRLAEESVYVYWDASTLRNDAEDGYAAPFSTDEYDATTRLRCRAATDQEFGSCPAGILRMEGGQASIVVQSQSGEKFTINLMSDYVNATNREVEADLEGDTWLVKVDDGDVYEVPLAAIEGG
jgi:hypothetical protein